MTCWCGVIIPRSCQQEREVPTKCLLCTCTFSWTLACAVRMLKRSRPLNNTLPCTKNNVRRQLVDMIACSGVNNKFAHKQTLTGCVLEPYISQLRRRAITKSPIEHWCSVISRCASRSSKPKTWLHRPLRVLRKTLTQSWVGKLQTSVLVKILERGAVIGPNPRHELAC